MSARDRLTAAAAALEARPLRERVLLLLAAAVLLLIVWDLGLRAPIADRGQHAADRVASIETQIDELVRAEQGLRTDLEALVDASPEQALARVRAELAEIDARLSERTARVVAPDQMTSVLHDMLAADPSLQLVALHNRGVEPLVREAGGEDVGGDAIPRVFRHRVEVVVQGDYFALLSYLQRLEALRWQFQWDELRIETVDYPTAAATISLSTLSLAEDWLGV